MPREQELHLKTHNKVKSVSRRISKKGYNLGNTETNQTNKHKQTNKNFYL